MRQPTCLFHHWLLSAIRPKSPNKSKQQLYHVHTVTIESHDERRFLTKSLMLSKNECVSVWINISSKLGNIQLELQYLYTKVRGLIISAPGTPIHFVGHQISHLYVWCWQWWSIVVDLWQWHRRAQQGTPQWAHWRPYGLLVPSCSTPVYSLSIWWSSLWLS